MALTLGFIDVARLCCQADAATCWNDDEDEGGLLLLVPPRVVIEVKYRRRGPEFTRSLLLSDLVSMFLSH